MIEILEKRNIKVILGAPTASPPKWLVNKYDVLLCDRYGRKRGRGSGVIFQNRSRQASPVKVEMTGTDLLTGEEFNGSLDGFGVVVLNKK